MKIWRALWKVMAALHYCEAQKDPSLAVVNTEPKGRRQTWSEGEAVRCQARAQDGLFRPGGGLACMWDGAVPRSTPEA